MKYTRAFAEAYPDQGFVQQIAAQIPWFHNCVLLDRAKDPEQRDWYIRATIQHGWSHAVLEHQIDSRLVERQGKAVTNSSRTLAAPQSDLAQQLLKDPYNFDVRHDTRFGIPDSIRGILGRRYPSQPAYQ